MTKIVPIIVVGIFVMSCAVEAGIFSYFTDRNDIKSQMTCSDRLSHLVSRLSIPTELKNVLNDLKKDNPKSIQNPPCSFCLVLDHFDIERHVKAQTFSKIGKLRGAAIQLLERSGQMFAKSNCSQEDLDRLVGQYADDDRLDDFNAYYYVAGLIKEHCMS